MARKNSQTIYSVKSESAPPEKTSQTSLEYDIFKAEFFSFFQNTTSNALSSGNSACQASIFIFNLSSFLTSLQKHAWNSSKTFQFESLGEKSQWMKPLVLSFPVASFARPVLERKIIIIACSPKKLAWKRARHVVLAADLNIHSTWMMNYRLLPQVQVGTFLRALGLHACTSISSSQCFSKEVALNLPHAVTL